MSDEEIKRRLETWFKKPEKSVQQLKFFTQHKKMIKGEVISWKYISDLICIAIRRRCGVQYFEHVKDLKTLPHWDIRGLIKKKLIDADKNGYVRHYVDQIVYEANRRWKNFRPQYPQ